MDERKPEISSQPVGGSCVRCGCALGHAASALAGEWFCCGPCAGSDRCSCGCQPQRSSEASTDRFVPTRRMFAARAPDELRRPQGYRSARRAFPFADRQRGR
jgi:hypothetical protein